MGGGQHFQSLPKSLPSHFRGRNDAWGQIPPPDWRAREVPKQLGSDGLGVWKVLGSDKPEPIRPFQWFCLISGFAQSHAPPLGYRARANASPLCMGLLRVVPQRQIRVWGASASARWAGVKRGKMNVTPLEKRAVSCISGTGRRVRKWGTGGGDWK